MTAALRASSVLCLARRASSYVYIGLGMIGIVSVMFALFQMGGFFFWPTYLNYPTGLFYSPIAQGGFLGLLIVAMIRIRWYAPIPILVLGLYLNPNRGGWVVAGIGLFATWVRQPLAILAVVLAGAFVLTSHLSTSDAWRLAIWYSGWEKLSLFGNGWGSFENIWLIQNGVASHPIHAHNDYLQLAFEFGLYAIPFFCLLAYALSKSSAPDWPILVAFATMAVFAMPSYIPATAALGALALTTILTGEDNG